MCLLIYKYIYIYIKISFFNPHVFICAINRQSPFLKLPGAPPWSHQPDRSLVTVDSTSTKDRRFFSYGISDCHNRIGYVVGHVVWESDDCVNLITIVI